MPELMGTLDTSVNGPEGLPAFDGDAWERVDWYCHEEQVRRLRGRIFNAAEGGDWPPARKLLNLMLRSLTRTLVTARKAPRGDRRRPTTGTPRAATPRSPCPRR